MKKRNGKTGRPIGFDKHAALEAAMLLFGERGYEGTSLADLTQAMGLNPSSIYAAFGDKHALFQLVVRRYMEMRGQYAGKALEEPTLESVWRSQDISCRLSHPVGEDVSRRIHHPGRGGHVPGRPLQSSSRTRDRCTCSGLS
jgi:AcrR family transcriptional regulator